MNVYEKFVWAVGGIAFIPFDIWSTWTSYWLMMQGEVSLWSESNQIVAQLIMFNWPAMINLHGLGGQTYVLLNLIALKAVSVGLIVSVAVYTSRQGYIRVRQGIAATVLALGLCVVANNAPVVAYVL